MALSNDLISQFVKATQDKEQTKKESTAYGKIVKQGDVEYVQLDGSDLLTPIEKTTVVKDGDRVIVTIKDHTATVTGDLTNPSASDKDVKEIGNKISEFEIVIANKVSTEQLEAEIARIETLRAKDLEATNAKFETIEGKVAEIDTIKADVVEIDGKVTAHEAEFTTMRADIADFKNVTTEEIDAIEGNFHTLESDYADFQKTVTTELTASEAKITDLETKKLDTETANAKYATIDFSNIGEAAVEKLFSDSGIIKDLIMSNGKVTGELVGVTIKGDLIEGNTVKADKLVILGEDGLYYKLNIDSLGEETVISDEKYQNGLSGSVIVAESITADKVSINDLVAFGATIGGYHINEHAIYSGAKESVSNTTRGVFLGDDGQIAIGDSNNYIKYFKNDNGEFQLDLRFSGTSIDETVNDLEGRVNNSIDEVRASFDNSINSLDESVTEISKTLDTKVSSEDVDNAIKTELDKGVDKVVTSTGFTFNNEGLTVSKTGSEMTTKIDEDGMVIKRNDEDQLIANNEGVIAYDLHAKTYLIVGSNSRFEDYEKNGKKQTGCFWIGDTEVE